MNGSQLDRDVLEPLLEGEFFLLQGSLFYVCVVLSRSVMSHSLLPCGL